jgi:hypothetical protein
MPQIGCQPESLSTNFLCSQVPTIVRNWPNGGAKPADLPVQQSTKFEFAINRKTAKALGLDIPLMLRAVGTQLID